jgi:hypothetical protein
VIFSHPVEAAEAADAALARGEHRAGFFDADQAGVVLFGGGDPENPIASGDGCGVGPSRVRVRSGGEGFE